MSKHRLEQILLDWNAAEQGSELHHIASALYPICRSITGNGLRQSLQFLQGYAPLLLHEVPTGTKVFDWIVPKEWNIRDAWVSNSKGQRIIDFQKSSLHVLQYSIPVRQKMRLAELQPHLFSLPDAPALIPYRTSYYTERWGFCVSHRLVETLADDEYDVCIDSTLQQGSLTYGELRIQGSMDDEVLFSCHSCHPSLCNDNLSGMAVATRLAQQLSQVPLRYSYRFLWIPGTIGSITWLALNEAVLPKIKHGLVLSCLGDRGEFTYKRSRFGNAEIDRVVEHVLRRSGAVFNLNDFTPYGYDERQYCSPGINLPVGCFMRTPNGQYPEYHTSADDLNFITPEAMAQSLRRLFETVTVLEQNCRYRNLSPKGEPQLGRRGLYRQTGGTSSSSSEEAVLWVLNLSDGSHSLLEIAERSKVPFFELNAAAEALLSKGLLEKIP